MSTPSSPSRVLLLSLLVLEAALSGCRPTPSRAEPRPEPEAIATTPTLRPPSPSRASAETSSTREPPSPPLRLERVRVPGDLPVAVVRGPHGEAPRIVFVPGLCSNALAYLSEIQSAGRAHGGVVAIDGDQPCKGAPGFRSFSWDAGKLHARIEGALAAAGQHAIPREGLVLVGYSQGAALGEQLVAQHPDRYARFVTIGAPTDPSPSHFVKARAVVTMSCDLDVAPRMREAAQKTKQARVPAAYFEMPGCRHGQIGDGERVFREVFDWIDANARPPSATAETTPIAGTIDEG